MDSHEELSLTDLPLSNRTLADWLVFSNTERPRLSLGPPSPRSCLLKPQPKGQGAGRMHPVETFEKVWENGKMYRQLLFAAGVLFLAGPAAVAQLEGRVRLREGTGAVSVAEERLVTVIWFELAGSRERPKPQTVEIVTQRKQFVPRVSVVPVGSTVRFPNEDPILHNVFSVHPLNRFDLGLYGKGPGKEVRLQHPGIVAVFCNVHHAMFAHIVVVETPYFAHPEADGRFRFDDVPPGSGVLRAWHERSEVFETQISIPSKPLEIELRLTRPKIPPHKNKHGRSYTGSRYGG